MSSSKYTEEFKQEVINFYNLNIPISFYKVSKKFNIDKKTIRYWIDPVYRLKNLKQSSNYINKTKTPKNNKKLSSVDIEKMKNLYFINKLSFRKISIIMKVCSKTVAYHLDDKEKNRKLNYMKDYKQLPHVQQRRLITQPIYYEKDKEKLKNDPILRNKKLLQKRKRRLNPLVFLSDRIRSNIVNSLTKDIKKGGQKWETLVGYDKIQLKEHIELQFCENMNWDNKNLWHIDHVLPIIMFNYDSFNHPHFKQCWCLDNLKPMWSSDNISKGGKIPTDEELEQWFENEPERLNTLKNIKNEVLNG